MVWGNIKQIGQVSNCLYEFIQKNQGSWICMPILAAVIYFQLFCDYCGIRLDSLELVRAIGGYLGLAVFHRNS